MAYELGTTYQLFSHCGTGLCLGVSGGTVANNKNVCIQTKNSNNQQKWIVKAFGSNLKIVSCLNQNYALNYYWSAGQGNAGNCDIYPQSGNDADSSVVLEPVATDVYRIKLKNYNLYLTAKGTGANADVRWEAPISSTNYNLRLPQEWRFLDPTEKGIRAPLIYAGFWKNGTAYTYTDAQLSGLDNATEFIINAGMFEEYFDTSGETNSNGRIQQYVVAAVEMVSRLRKKYPNKQVWIGTPLVGINVPYEGSEGTAAFAKVGVRMTYFIDNIIAQFNLKGLDFNSCVKGFYMDREGIMNPFNWEIPVSSNCEVNMFQTVANYVAAKGKKMLWIPYWADDNIIKAACVAQQTNIFDYVLIQPGYFEGGRPAGTSTAIRKSIAMQRICDLDETPIVPINKISRYKTVIGCDMEISQQYSIAENKTHFDYTKGIFSTAYGAFDKYNANFAFYFSAPYNNNDSEYNQIKAIVNSFFG